MAEVGGPGAWSKLFWTPDLGKFDLPTVTGVDFPTLGIARAWNDTEDGVLHAATTVGDSGKAGTETRFRIDRLPDSAAVRVRCDDTNFENWRIIDRHTIEIATDIGAHDFQVLTGAHDGGRHRHGETTGSHPSGGGAGLGAAPIQVNSVGFSSGLSPRPAMSAGPGCPCCFGI